MSLDTCKKPLKRILVGTDFSREATRAVERAAMLAAEHGAKLEIVHVKRALDRSVLRRLGVNRRVVREADPTLRRHLDEAVSQTRLHNVRATAKLASGSAAAELTREAARWPADLVVVGARGERLLRDAVIGTTAERLMERCSRDILIVRRLPRSSYHTILICVALGPVSSSVVSSAIALSARPRLHLLHVYEPPFEKKLLSQEVSWETIENHRLATRREAAEGVRELLEGCAVPAGRQLATILRRGNPPHEILAAAARLEADVIVVGKNQSTIEEFFLGSATKHVIRGAAADVLISAAH